MIRRFHLGVGVERQMYQMCAEEAGVTPLMKWTKVLDAGDVECRGNRMWGPFTNIVLHCIILK